MCLSELCFNRVLYEFLLGQKVIQVIQIFKREFHDRMLLFHTGFEMMTGADSPRILSCMLMTRQFDQQNLEGIVYDNACNLHWYFLNREPKDCQNLRFIVDRCHFQG